VAGGLLFGPHCIAASSYRPLNLQPCLPNIAYHCPCIRFAMHYFAVVSLLFPGEYPPPRQSLGGLSQQNKQRVWHWQLQALPDRHQRGSNETKRSPIWPALVCFSVVTSPYSFKALRALRMIWMSNTIKKDGVIPSAIRRHLVGQSLLWHVNVVISNTPAMFQVWNFTEL